MLVALLAALASAPAPDTAPPVQRPQVQRPSQTPSQTQPETPEPVSEVTSPPAVPERPPAVESPAEPSVSPEAPAPAESAPAPPAAPPVAAKAPPVTTEPIAPGLEAEAVTSDAGRPGLVELEGSGDAWVDVMVISELDKRPRPGIRVSLWCETCGSAPGFKVSQSGGVATFRGVLAGRYTVVAYSPGGPIEGIVEVPANERVGVRLALPRDPYRPKDSKGRLNYPGLSTNPTLRKAQVPMAVGGVFLAAGVGLGIGALVEGLVPDCRYGNDSCGGPPRPAVTRGLAIGAGISGALGIAGLTWGAVNYRRWRYGVGVDSEGASVSVSGRF